MRGLLAFACAGGADRDLCLWCRQLIVTTSVPQDLGKGFDAVIGLTYLEVTPDGAQARLTITEGRYHQVRRIFAAVGNHVVTLHRERIGGILLPDDLAPGQHRILPAAQAEQVFADG